MNEEAHWDRIGEGWIAPRAMREGDMQTVITAYREAVRRATAAGFEIIELHAAHGYLLHTFLSPLSNLRGDEYGGDLAGRMRFPLAVIGAVREVWPAERPLLLRISATDWVDGGWDLDSSVELARAAAALGVDLVDVSSGGLDPRQQITVGPAYQAPFAARVRADAGVPTGAVGLITEAPQAERLVADGAADVVLLARELLRDPRWPLRAAHELGAEGRWPSQYLRARPG